MEEVFNIEVNSKAQESTQVDWQERLQSHFFALLVDSFFPTQSKKKSSTLSIAFCVSVNFLQLCHMFSLIEWTSSDMLLVRRVAMYTRIDVLAVRLGLVEVLVITSFVLFTLPTLGAAAILWKKEWNLKICQALVYWPVQYFVHIAFIPSLVFHSIFIKGALSLEGSVSEYENPTNAEFQGSIEAVLSVFVVCGVVIYNLCYHWLLYSMSHHKGDPFARSRSLAVGTDVQLRMVMIGAYVLYGSSVWVSVLYFCLTLWTIKCYIQTLPYYEFWVNVLCIGSVTAFLWSAAVKLLVSWLQDESCALILLIFVTILLYPLVAQLVRIRYSKFKRSTENSFTSIYAFDLTLRQYLQSQNPSTSSLFREGQKHLNSDFLILWEAHMLLDRESEHNTAVLKVALNPQRSFSLEVAFQRFLIEKQVSNLENLHKTFLKSLNLLTEAKKEDEYLCLMIRNLCAEFLSSALDVKKFEHLAIKIIKKKERLSKKYQKLMEKYKNQSELFALFGSFLTDILNDPSGQKYLDRSSTMIHRNRARSIPGVIAMFIDPPRLGKISLVTDQALTLFMVNQLEFKSLDIESLLPPDIRPLHSRVLQEALETGHFQELDLLYRFLLDSDGFLIHSKPSTSVATWNLVPFLLIYFSERVQGEKLILDVDCSIIAHTRTFSRFSLANTRARDVFLNFPDPIVCSSLFLELIGESQPVAASITEFHLLKTCFYEVSLTPKEQSLISPLCEREEKEVKFPLILAANSTKVVTTSISLAMEGITRSRTDSKIIKLYLSSESSRQKAENCAEKARINKATKRFKLILLMSVLAVIAVALAVLFLLINTVAILQNQDSLRSIARLRYVPVEMASAVRCISLIQSGFWTEKESFYRSMMLSDIGYYALALNQTLEKLDSWPNGPYKQMHFDNVIPQWIYYTDNQSTLEMESLFTLMYSWLNRANLTYYTPRINFTDPNVLYLFRNGPAEDSHFSNKSIFLFLSDEGLSRSADLDEIDSLLICLACIFCFSMTVVIVPQMVALEQVNSSAWHRIYQIPTKNVINLKQRVSDRLETIHGLELPAIDSGKRIKEPHPRSLWPMYALKLLVLVLITAAFFSWTFLYVYRTMQNELITIPNFMNWLQLYQLDYSGTCFWNREQYLSTFPDLSYTKLLSDNQYWTDPTRITTQLRQSFEFSKTLLRESNDSYGIYPTGLSAQYQDFYMSESCSQLNVTNCTNTALHLGLHYQANEFMQMASDMSAAITNKVATKTQVLSCEAKRSILTTGQRFFNTLYENQAHGGISVEMQLIEVAVILYSLSLLCFYFVICRVAVNSSAKRLHMTTELAQLLDNVS